MFEFLRLSGTEESGIALETRLRTRVANAQAPAPSERDMRIFGLLLTQHPDWEARCQPCGIYNCFGHIWASRRTAIYEETEVETILGDDGYRRLGSGEGPLQGDIALYYDPARTELWHGGLVCELRRMVNASGEPVGRPVPWILSKLSAVHGEVLHRAMDVHSPYREDRFTLEFWTERPQRETA